MVWIQDIQVDLAVFKLDHAYRTLQKWQYTPIKPLSGHVVWHWYVRINWPCSETTAL